MTLALLILAALPLALILANLPLYRLAKGPDPDGDSVSILIPARNEASQIESAVRAALKSTQVSVEVIVLDDDSSDDTAAIVESLSQEDARVKLIRGTGLPAGWMGKVHACWNLAKAASGEWLLFVDADVQVSEDAASRLVSSARKRRVDLISGIPRQVTGTLGEKLVIPLIHLVLLGYLPMVGMRLSRHPAFAAGIGQLLFVNAAAYRDCGGHEAIRGEIQDGVALARLFREHKKQTDLVDLTAIATCRMYDNFKDVWHGFAKNAHAGMGGPVAIWIWTTLLMGGHVLPWLVSLAYWLAGQPVPPMILLACGLSALSRVILTLCFRQSWISTILHPVGVGLIVVIQWYGLTRWLMRKPVAWKGRTPP